MNSHYTRYYLNQSGGNLADIGELYRSPLIYQRERGIGSFFTGLLRYLRPLIASGANAIKQQAVTTGKAILEDIGSKPIQNILKEQGKVAVQELAQKGINKLFDSMGGAGINKRNVKKRPNPFTSLQPRSLFKHRRRSKSKKSAGKKSTSRARTSAKRKRNSRKRILDIFDK